MLAEYDDDTNVQERNDEALGKYWETLENNVLNKNRASLIFINTDGQFSR